MLKPIRGDGVMIGKLVQCVDEIIEMRAREAEEQQKQTVRQADDALSKRWELQQEFNMLKGKHGLLAQKYEESLKQRQELHDELTELRRKYAMQPIEFKPDPEVNSRLEELRSERNAAYHESVLLRHQVRNLTSEREHWIEYSHQRDAAVNLLRETNEDYVKTLHSINLGSQNGSESLRSLGKMARDVLERRK